MGYVYRHGKTWWCQYFVNNGQRRRESTGLPRTATKKAAQDVLKTREAAPEGGLRPVQTVATRLKAIRARRGWALRGALSRPVDRATLERALSRPVDRATLARALGVPVSRLIGERSRTRGTRRD